MGDNNVWAGKNIFMNKWLTSTVDTYIKNFGKSHMPLIYEVGSRDGHDGRELSQRIHSEHNVGSENVKLVFFECNPPQVEVIKGNYPEATLITNAISDVSGETVDFLQIHGDINMIGSSTMNVDRNDPWIKETSKVKVKTKRLDEVIEELGHQKEQIDIMKIDIEGYTYEALESLGKYLRNVRVFHLETEVESVARNKTNIDIALYMQERGYLCTSLEGEWLPDIQDQVWIRID